MIEEKGKETKSRKCVCCGEMTVVTKFMSDAVVKCEPCKTSKQPVDEAILAEIKGAKSSKAKEVSDNSPITSDGKKSAVCVQCGEDMLIGKFASAKTCVCDDCKGIVDGKDQYADDDEGGSGNTKKSSKPKIDLSRIDRSMLPTLDEAYVMPQLINNRKLRQVTCPACGHEFMKIIKIIDSSPNRGLVIVYQCHKCLVALTLSEQCIKKMIASPMHKMFNYRAEEIESMIDSVSDVRAKNAVEYMIQLCRDNGVDVSGCDMPDNILVAEKKVPIGIDPNWKDGETNE